MNRQDALSTVPFDISNLSPGSSLYCSFIYSAPHALFFIFPIYFSLSHHLAGFLISSSCMIFMPSAVYHGHHMSFVLHQWIGFVLQFPCGPLSNQKFSVLYKFVSSLGFVSCLSLYQIFVFFFLNSLVGVWFWFEVKFFPFFICYFVFLPQSSLPWVDCVSGRLTPRAFSLLGSPFSFTSPSDLVSKPRLSYFGLCMNSQHPWNGFLWFAFLLTRMTAYVPHHTDEVGRGPTTLL